MFCTHLWLPESTHAPDNLALEHYLLDHLTADQAHIMLWRSSPTVLIGRAQNPWYEADTQYTAAHNIPVLRRISGGGTVYHDLGNLNISFLAPPRYYNRDFVTTVLHQALHSVGITTTIDARHSSFVAGAKISGSAFRETKRGGLHHATVLVTADLAQLQRCLQAPRHGMQVRGIPSQPASVSNIRDHNAALDVATTQQLLVDAFKQACQPWGVVRWRTPDAPEYAAALPYRTQYDQWEWNYGKTPRFSHTIATGAGVQVRHGRIANVSETPELAARVGQPYDPALVTAALHRNSGTTPQLGCTG